MGFFCRFGQIIYNAKLRRNIKKFLWKTLQITRTWMEFKLLTNDQIFIMIKSTNSSVISVEIQEMNVIRVGGHGIIKIKNEVS